MPRERRYPEWLVQVHDVLYFGSVVVPGPLFLVSFPASIWTNPEKGRPNILKEEAHHIRFVEGVRVLAMLAGALVYLSGFHEPEAAVVVGAINLGLGIYNFAYYTKAVVSGLE